MLQVGSKRSPLILFKIFFYSTFFLCMLACSSTWGFVFLNCTKGAVAVRVDTVVAEGSGVNSSVSVQGVSLAVVKAITESMEPCCPAAQTPKPILTLTTFTVSYHISTRSLEVVHCSCTQLAWPQSHRINYIITTSSQKWLQWLHENAFIVSHLFIYSKTVHSNWNPFKTIVGS